VQDRSSELYINDGVDWDVFARKKHTIVQTSSIMAKIRKTGGFWRMKVGRGDRLRRLYYR
jgi:hypothetical protein